MYPPQRGGVRATTIHDLVPIRFPEWVHGRTRRMHTAKYRERGADVRRGVRQLGFHGARGRSSCSACRRSVSACACPASTASSAPDGERGRSRRAVRAHRGDARAAEEPRRRSSPPSACSGRDDLMLAVVGAAGWGEQPRLDHPGIVRLGYVDDDELARLYRGAAAFVYPSRFEGFGHPGRRGDGERRPGRRLVARVDGRGVRRRGGARRSRERRGDRRGDRARRSGAATSSARARLAHAAPLHLASRPAARSSRLPGGGADAGRARRLAARPDAPRAPRATSRRSSGSTGVERRPARASRPGPRRRRSSATPSGIPLVLPRRATSGARRRPPLPDVPRAAARRRVPARRHGSRPRRAAPPGDLQPWTRHYSRRCCLSGGAGGEARDRGVRVHEGARSSSCSACRRSGSASSPTASTRRSRRTGPRPTATTCSPSGRSSRARTSRGSPEATRRLGVELRVVGAPRLGPGRARRRRALARPRLRRRARAPLPRRALSSPTRRSTRASASRSLEAMACGTPVVTSRGRCDGGDRRRRGRARRPARRRLRSRAGIEEALARRDELRPARARACARRSAGTRPRARDGRRLPRGCRVTCRSSSSTPTCSAAQRTGDETYVENLLPRAARLAGRRASLRRAHAPPRPRARRRRGRRTCRPARRSCGWSGPCRARSAGCGPALAHFQHALPLARARAPRS